MIRTKIIATVGPASDSPDLLGRLIDAGVDVFRLNFSHGTLEQHARTYENIRAVARERHALVAVMGDLCGPKIRVDPIEGDGFSVAVGDRLDIVAEHILGSAGRVSTNRPELVREVHIGHRVLIDDGAVRFRVVEVGDDQITCVCEVDGIIRTRKGINLPDSDLAMSALTENDRENAAWAFAHGVDYVAMSFVRTAADLRELCELVPLQRDACRIVAKIETPQAVDHLDEIIEMADVILVARGDLGVEMDLARVPLLQKEMARKCQAAGKPVIIATQMLQSMVEHPTATRAEVSDVANAILDAADGIMLSAETSVGDYPVEAVQMMDRIAARTEAYLAHTRAFSHVDMTATLRPVTTAVAHGASMLAQELDAKLVAVWTATGNTARLLSKCRLNRPVVGLSPDEHVCRRMALFFGVVPVQLVRQEQMSAMLRDVDEMLLTRNLVGKGDLIVVVAGTRLDKSGSTNSLLIHLVGVGTPEDPAIAL